MTTFPRRPRRPRRPRSGSRGLRLVAAALGLTLVTGCSGSVYDLPLPGGPDTGDEPMTVHVRFRDVLDLVPNSLVKVNDVSVGKVTAIDLKGYTADVTLKLPGKTDLPDNTEATIRQTSLLGEKFVSLAPPSADPEGRLQSGDTIPLSRSGRNPEVEEVFGALSLLLNGGGVAQLRMIAQELNNALGGRESDVRNTLEQLRQFTGQLDQRKQQVVDAIESLNRLAIAAKRQDSTIKLTLDELPSSIASINRQRGDLVKTLKALDNLSDVGVRVIKQTKANTITTLRDLGPVLDKVADAGSAFPRSIQVQLTYPFVDEAVGRNPAVARNLHFGDYVNLDANLDINSDFLNAGCKFLVNEIGTLGKNLGVPTDQLPTVILSTLQSLSSQLSNGCDALTKGADDLTAVIGPVLAPILGQLGLDQPLTKLNDILKNLPGLSTTNDLGGDATSKPLQGLQGLTQRRSNGGGILGGLLGGGPSSGSTTAPKKSSGSSSPKSGSSSGSSGSSGGLLGGLFGGFGRTATGYDVARAVREGNGKSGDVLNGPVGTTSEIGYNSTLGALLLQGVSSS